MTQKQQVKFIINITKKHCTQIINTAFNILFLYGVSILSKMAKANAIKQVYLRNKETKIGIYFCFKYNHQENVRIYQ